MKVRGFPRELEYFSGYYNTFMTLITLYTGNYGAIVQQDHARSLASRINSCTSSESVYYHTANFPGLWVYLEDQRDLVSRLLMGRTTVATSFKGAITVAHLLSLTVLPSEVWGVGLASCQRVEVQNCSVIGLRNPPRCVHIASLFRSGN